MRKATLMLVAIVFAFSSQVQAQQKTIVETAIGAGNFNTLVTAVKAAGLVDTLNRYCFGECWKHHALNTAF